MKLFSYLYNKTIDWSGHRHAPYYLAGVSFIESSFFPIPPEVMLVTMGLATPFRSWNYAFIATIASVLGGILGYVIGVFGISVIEPYLISYGYEAEYLHIRELFNHYGVWVIIMAGVVPIPYKVFTITAGAMQMAFFPFVLSSLISRGTRFFIVSSVLFFVGPKIEKHLREYIDILGWIGLGILVIGYCLIKWVI